jgi:DNA-binding MarR family transcriptional regulator
LTVSIFHYRIFPFVKYTESQIYRVGNMPTSESEIQQRAPEIAEIIQRMLRLRPTFRGGLPEQLLTLRNQYLASRTTARSGGPHDFNLFYNVGIVLSHHENPITMGELSHELDVPLSTATRIMDWMVDNGYAQRLPDPEDRRVVRVALTAVSLEVYRTINEFIMERVEQILGQFTPDECDIFLSLLRKVLDALEQAT